MIERPMKVIITCKNSDASLSDLETWAGIPVKRYNSPTTGRPRSDTFETEHLSGLVSILCPGHHGEARIHQALHNLISMKRQRLENILWLIQRLSGWPKEPSSRSLEQFCSLLQRVSLSSTPGDILDLALRDIPNQKGVRWSSGDKITPPLVGDDEDIIFYTIESLPYHLSKSHELLRTLGDILSVAQPIYAPNKDPDDDPAVSAVMESLDEVMRDGNEDLALSLAKKICTPPGEDVQKESSQ
ncbi:hypothetical protein FAUST_11950 [Fusarium austroamericanum]|uniref:Uncharacterized protein n=1 Tax=Fusarium austroamericanum TaxID=282268 RepID=A0AAN5Z0J8_FUSAU|nr:hypothetical protein FAUST_11950 [Fusarium austroamericanum]